MKTVGIIAYPGPGHHIVYNQVEDQLIQSIAKAGILPFIIPITAMEELSEYFSKIDGLIFAGKTDIAPFYYGAEPLATTGTLDLAHDQFEMTILKQAIGQLPILGIERGCQLINIALGGSLQPVESDIIHRGAEVCYHSLTLRPDSLLGEVLGERVIVASDHGYQVADLAPELRWSAKSRDGIIEALEHVELPIWGVQFPVHRMPADLAQAFFMKFKEQL